MNKIFKVVWNRTIGSFVVTSELAKGRVKSSSEGAEGDVRASEEGRLKTLFRLTALSAALFGLSESAWAHPIINSTAPANTTGIVATGNASETAVGGGSARGVGSVAVGAFAKAGTRIEADGAVAIGGSQASTGAFADGNNAIAIGQASNANAAKAISIGSDTIASHEWTSAYGGRAEAKNVGATALGSWTQANGEFSIAVGGSDRFGGERSTGTIASGDRSTAIGRIARSAGADAIALGTGAQATLTNSIAIGKNSVATGVNNIAKNPVNVGNAVAIGPGVQALGEDSVAIGVSAGANLTQATTKQSLAIGWTAKATGTAQAVAIGPDAIASGAQSTSIGNNTRATGDSSIAIGGDDWNIVREKTVAAAGNKQVHQIYQDLTGVEMKKQGQAYGNPFKGTTAGDAAVAVGVTALAEGVLSTAFGSGTSASGIGAAAFGVGASASQDKSVAIGAGSRTNTDATAVTTATVNGITYSGFAGTEHITPGSQVSFGSAGYERQLKHVAPGAITATSTDAINGSQLYALHAGSGNIAKAVADALGGGAAVGIDPTNNQGTVTLPSYDVLKGSDTPNTAGNGTAKFNTTPAKNVAAAMTNLNTYVNQGFAVKDNAGDAKGIVTPGESVQFADGNATTVTVDTEADGNTKIKYDVKVDDKTIKVVDGKLTGASQTHFYSVKNEDQTKGNYNNDGATGENAIAAGPEAKAAASNAVVMGNKATVEAAAGSDSAINGETTGEGSVAVGALSKANGKNATAIGQKANAYGQNSFAGGQDTESSGKSSVAIGDGSRATDNSTTAVGPYAKAQKAGASAFGFNANAQAIGSVAVGRQAQALNLNAVSVGNESKAKGEDTVAIGTSADAVQNRAMAIGKGAVANGADTIAFGAATKADQRYAIAIGSGNNAWKEDSVALGRAANANGAASLALGLSSHTREANAIALGNNANADDTNSIAIGTNSKAAQAAAVAIGNNATALKYSSIVIGEEAKSNNSRSVVIGYYASATNPAMSASNQDTNQTVAIGAYANAWGDQSTAIGNNVDAKGNSSIAIGADDWDTVAVKTVEGTGKTVKEVYQDYTGDVMETGSYTHTTSSEAAVAIGTKSQAIGQLSTAFGTGTIAEGVASAAFGMGAKATQGNSVAIGAGSTTASGAIGVNEATVNNLKYSGFAGGNNVNPGDQVSFGSKNYERQLKNVAPGEISNTSTDAINGSQLYAVQNVLGNTAQTVKNVLGGDAAVDENGSITMSNIGNTGKGNIHDAIKSVKETADKGWKLKANDEADSDSEKIAAGDTVTVKQGKNIRVKRSGKDLTIETEDDVAFNKVTVGNSELTTTGLTTPKVTAGDSVLTTDGLNIANGTAGSPVSLTKDGLNNGGNKVTDVAKGTADTDAVNFSQLNPIAKALNTTVNPDGSIAAPNFTVKHADGTEGTPVHTVQDALDKVGEEVTKGINVGGTTGSNKYALGGTINIKGDSNIVSDTVEGGVQLKLADTVKIGQDSGKPVSIDGTAGTVSGLSNTTLGNTPLAGSNKAATEAQLDATQVNLKNILGGEAKNENGNVSTEDIGGTGENTIHDAIKSVKATADKGWKLKANDEADSDSEKIAAGDTVTVKQGKNIRVKRSGKDLTIETEDDVAFNKVTVGNSELTTTGLTTPKVTAGDSVLTTDGLNIANGTAGSPVSLTKDGLNNGGNKVTDVAKGTADTDGVNVSQLNPVAKALNTNIDPTTGEVAAPSFTVTKADGTKHPAVGTVQDALDKVGEEVTKGLNIVADNGSSEKVNLGDTVKYTSKDKNIVTTSGTGKAIDFSLAEKVTIGKDAANGGKPVVIDGKEGIVSGLTNTTLGAAPLAGSNKAATEAQLDATQVNLANVLGGNAANNNGNVTTSDIGGTGEDNIHDAIKSVKATADKGWNLNANDETSSEKIAAGDTVTFKEGKNVKVSRNGKSITIATSDDVSFKTVTVGDSVLTDNGLTVGNGKAGKPVSLTKDGLNNGGNKIANVAAGEADTDAVNVAQLKAAAAKATSKVESGNDNIVVAPEQNADGSTTYKVATAPNLKADSFTAGDTVVNKDGVKVGDKVALGRDGLKAGDVNITADGINAGNKAISNVAEGKKDTDAVNVAQLKAAAAKATSKVESGNDNIVVTPEQNADGSTTYKVATAPDLKADSLTTGDTVVNNDGVKVGDKVALTKDGLDNGGNKVANVAAGEADTDAVNVAQLKAAAAKATSKVESGNDNIVVTPEQNADGSTTYKVATAPDLKADSLTTGDTVVNNDGVKVGDKVALGKDGLKAGDVNITADGINAGNKAISNVAEGKKDTDAVNVGQLNRLTAAAKTEVEAGTNIASVSSKQGANGQTVYTVNADGASVSAGSDNIVVTKGNKDANNVTDYAVDLSKAVKADIAKGVAAKDAVDNKGISFAGDSGTTVANKLGDTVAVKGDANITTTAGANGIQVGLNKDLKVDSVTTGGVTVNAQGISIGAPTAYNPANTVSLSPNGLNNGGQRITNVAPAKEGTDAVNLNQLVGMGNALQNNIANVGKKAYAGVAGAIAQGSIPQVTRPGATGIGVGSGYYGGQSAMAIGVSAMSDGGNWVVKGNFSANTDGHVGVGAGALYQW